MQAVLGACSTAMMPFPMQQACRLLQPPSAAAPRYVALPPVVRARQRAPHPQLQQLCRHRKQQPQGWALAAAAAAAEAAGATEDDDDDPQQQMAQLPRPSQQLQPQLTGKQRAALRAQSEALIKSKALQRVQVGSKGVTLNVLHSIMDILMRHEFVRVKLGEGCGLERKQTAEQLAQLLDAAVVGQVGFTITLYRQQGLPRPDSLAKP